MKKVTILGNEFTYDPDYVEVIKTKDTITMKAKELTPEEKFCAFLSKFTGNTINSMEDVEIYWNGKELMRLCEEYAQMKVKEIDTFKFEKGDLSKEEQLILITLLKKGVVIKPIIKI